MKELVGCGVSGGFARTSVEKVCGCGEGFSPPLGRHGGMDEKGANAVIDGTKYALSFAILLGRIRAGEA